MPWQRLSTVVSPQLAERVSDALEAHGALAVTLVDAADQPLYEPPPGATPMWQATRVEGLFAPDLDWESLAGTLAAQLALDGAPWHCELLADRAWEREWMDRFRPMRFGRRLWICPSAHPVPPQADVVIRLDPGLAFGTGTHPTTAMCLEALDELDLGGLEVLDIGCGSGVLAIAALLLDAASAVALDIDRQALVATRENAAGNGVAARLRTAMDIDTLPGRSADLVLANILAGPLIALAPALARLARPAARLVLSGILVEQAPAVVRAYAPHFALEAPRRREQWVALVGRRLSS